LAKADESPETASTTRAKPTTHFDAIGGLLHFEPAY
jgi:hypothetical protein